jgi:large subunit ribosomal protein L6
MGKKVIVVPGNVKVNVAGSAVQVEGPLGKLSYTLRSEVVVTVDSATKQVKVDRKEDTRTARAVHGLTRALVANMVEGVSKGYSKSLEIYGTGYGVKQEGMNLALTVGFANVVKLAIPAGVKLEIKTPQSRSNTQPAEFTISGADKQVIGEFAARIRRVKKTEPYLGKGIRFAGEHIRRKAGKAFGAGS